MPTQTIEVLRIPGTLFPRGAFDENADYKFLNIVESGGSGYVCLQPCTGIPVTNTAYWFKFVFKGDKGDAFTYADLTAEQKAELVRDATAAALAAASSAQSAADDAAAVLQKFNTIKAAIDAIDPQSTEGSIQTLAAKQGLLEADLNALGPKIDKTTIAVGTVDDYDFDISSYESVPYFVNSSGKWANVTTATSFTKLIPIGHGTYKIKASAGGEQCIYAILSSDEITVGSNAPFAIVNGTQITSRVLLPVGQEATIVIDDASTARFLAVRADTSGGAPAPQYFRMVGGYKFTTKDDVSNELAKISDSLVFKLAGKGTTYVSREVQGWLPGHTYRLFLEDWEIDSSTSDSSYVLRIMKGDANIVALYYYNWSSRKPYYDVTVEDGYTYKIGGRAASNSEIVLGVVDITSLLTETDYFVYFQDGAKPTFTFDGTSCTVTMPQKIMRIYRAGGGSAAAFTFGSATSYTIGNNYKLVLNGVNTTISVVAATTDEAKNYYLLLGNSGGVLSGLLAPFYYDSLNSKIEDTKSQLSDVKAETADTSKKLIPLIGYNKQTTAASVAGGGIKVMEVDLMAGREYRIWTETVAAASFDFYYGVRDSEGNALKTGGAQSSGQTKSSILKYTPSQDYTSAYIYVSVYSGQTLSNVKVCLEVLPDSESAGISTLYPSKDVKYLLAKLHNQSYSSGNKINPVTTLLHFSDLHGDSVNLARINEFRNIYGEYIDDAVASGDQIYSQYADDFTFWDNNAADVLLCLGNHEIWNSATTQEGSDIRSAADCFTKYFGGLSQWDATHDGDNTHCYYYKDYSSGVRLIVVDLLHWDSTQSGWLADVLADAITNDKTIVGMGHYALGGATTFVHDTSCTFDALEVSSGGTGWSPAVISNARTEAESIINTFISNGGTFAVWLAGHTHADYFGTTENGLPTIVIEAATTARFSFDHRLAGTRSQDSFNIITIDVVNKKFYVLRIGNDVDKMMRSKKLLCYDYENKRIIWNS